MQERPRAVPLIVFFIAAIPFLAFCTHQPEYPSAPTIGRNIAIDAARLEPGVPKFHTYHYQGKSISFFVLKTDGKVISFFDACASCYPHKRGFRYEDRRVTCRNCSQEFPVNKLEQGLGSCFPMRIEGRLEQGKYLIPLAALEAEAGKF